jgi:hypothetical protein
MRSRTWSMPVIVGLIAVSGCENEPLSNSAEESAVQAQAPAGDNVFPVDFTETITCDNDETLVMSQQGWVQIHRNPNVQLRGVHVVVTFTNSGGETFRFLDVGTDRVYVKNGNLYLSVIGRASGSFLGGFIGHAVLNLTTGEVTLTAGKALGDLFDVACEALT